MEDFHFEEDNQHFKWIGKILNLNTLEVFHTQILDKIEAF